MQNIKMNFLKVLPYPKPVELNILTDYDAFIFAVIAILLTIVFIKIKFFKKSVEPKEFYEKQNNTQFEIESRDVLMQPKKKIDESEIPFKDFSLDPFHIIFAIILFIIFIYFLEVTR